MLVTTRLGRGLAPGVQHPFPFYLSPSGPRPCGVCLLFLVGRSELGHNDGVTVSGCQPCIFRFSELYKTITILAESTPDPECDPQLLSVRSPYFQRRRPVASECIHEPLPVEGKVEEGVPVGGHRHR